MNPKCPEARERWSESAQNEQDDKSIFAFGLWASMRYPAWTDTRLTGGVH